MLPDAEPSEIRRRKTARHKRGRGRLVVDLECRLQNVEGHAASKNLAEETRLVLKNCGIAAVAVQAEDVQKARTCASGHGRQTFDDGDVAAVADAAAVKQLVDRSSWLIAIKMPPGDEGGGGGGESADSAESGRRATLCCP
jgi:hypothetical protein